MAFADNLKQLASVERIEKLELLARDGALLATLENKPGQAGSVAVYHHLFTRHGAIHEMAAREGLTLYAEHTKDAKLFPGKHPNIDRLLRIVEEKHPLQVRVHWKK